MRYLFEIYTQGQISGRKKGKRGKEAMQGGEGDGGKRSWGMRESHDRLMLFEGTYTSGSKSKTRGDKSGKIPIKSIRKRARIVQSRFVRPLEISSNQVGGGGKEGGGSCTNEKGKMQRTD